jgi:hypothetical protein
VPRRHDAACCLTCRHWRRPDARRSLTVSRCTDESLGVRTIGSAAAEFLQRRPPRRGWQRPLCTKKVSGTLRSWSGNGSSTCRRVPDTFFVPRCSPGGEAFQSASADSLFATSFSAKSWWQKGNRLKPTDQTSQGHSRAKCCKHSSVSQQPVRHTDAAVDVTGRLAN